MKPTPSSTVEREAVEQDVGERPPGEHRGARHRQRAEAVDQALLHVLGEPERGDEPAERDRLDDDARHQEVDVVEARRLDRAAEDVHEQQHEHHRLDRVRDQQVGLARDPLEVAAREHQRVGDRVGELMPPPPPRPASSAAWPVSAMKTSSSVGRRSAMSSMPTSAASSRRTASAIAPGAGAPARGRRRPRATGARWPSRPAPRSPLGVARRLERDLEALAADPVLELVGRSLGDHVAVVDHDDLVREAVGLIEVLGGQEHRRALGHAPLDRLPHVSRARGSRPVVGSSRNSTGGR